MYDPVAIGSAAADPHQAQVISFSQTRPASRKTCRRAAVIPQPSRFPSSIPAPHGRGVRCRGSPLATSREARCRAAVIPQPSTIPHTRPASRGTFRATAVIRSQAACLPTPLRAPGAQSGVQGVTPCLAAGAVDFDDVAALAELLEHPVDLLQTLDLYHHGDDAGLFFLVPLGRDRHNGNVHVSDAHGQLAQ